MIIPALKKTYNGKTVLNIPETEIPDNGITAICGHNGSGKSTLAKILAGIVKDDNGKYPAINKNVGYMNQMSLAFKMSVRNNLLLNSDRRRSRRENQLWADELIKRIGLADVSSKNASRLSGGQTERMALARIMMKDYDLLILDEPTASMDRLGIEEAENMIKDYQRRTGCIVLIITHSADQAERLADKTITLEDGLVKSFAQ